jgi:murein DD-endopeptidase MepM/ murein hydrolase activator NlpD
MSRARRAISRVELTWRLLTPLLAVALVLSAGVVAPAAVEAGGSSSVASIRGRQLSAEGAMRRADKQILRLQGERRHHTKLFRKAKKQLKGAIKQRKAAERKADVAHSKLSDLKLTLARQTRVHPNPKGTQKVDKPKLRKRIRKLQKSVRQLDKKVRRAEKKVDQKRALKQSRLKKPTKARIAARVAERERAEDKLNSAIGRMLSLSKERAGRIGTSSGRGFMKPAKGRISQAYGCTGLRTNPRRGSCRRFHDGLDIAAPKGSRVRASADGYVAYVGFSPWDPGARAYVVIIGHSRGYETVYAHLQPKRKVRAGQKVKKGDVLGTVGMTGLTTGPHVHWEVKKGGTNVNPQKAGR